MLFSLCTVYLHFHGLIPKWDLIFAKEFGLKGVYEAVKNGELEVTEMKSLNQTKRCF